MTTQYYIDKCAGLRHWLDLWLNDYLWQKKKWEIFRETGKMFFTKDRDILLPFEMWWIENKHLYLTEPEEKTQEEEQYIRVQGKELKIYLGERLLT